MTIMIWNQNQAVNMIINQLARTCPMFGYSASSNQLEVCCKDQTALTKSSSDHSSEAESLCQSYTNAAGAVSSASGIKAPPVMKRKGRPNGHELTTIGIPLKKANKLTTTKPYTFSWSHCSRKEQATYACTAKVYLCWVWPSKLQWLNSKSLFKHSLSIIFCRRSRANNSIQLNLSIVHAESPSILVNHIKHNWSHNRPHNFRGRTQHSWL